MIKHNPKPNKCSICGVPEFSYDNRPPKYEYITFPDRGKVCCKCISNSTRLVQLSLFELCK